MSEHSDLTKRLINEAVAKAKPLHADLIADLARIAEGFHFTATRVGAPGCSVRLRAAEDERTVQAAIEVLRQVQFRDLAVRKRASKTRSAA